MIDAMKEHTDVFTYCDNFADGNLYQCIYENGGHDVQTVIHIMFNGLPKMFGEATRSVATTTTTETTLPVTKAESNDSFE